VCASKDPLLHHYPNYDTRSKGENKREIIPNVILNRIDESGGTGANKGRIHMAITKY